MAEPTGGVYKTGYMIRLGSWARDPCCRCHRQPKEGEVVNIDWVAQTVLCAQCVNDDTTQLANALSRAMDRAMHSLDGLGGTDVGSTPHGRPIEVHHRHWEPEPCNDRCHEARPPLDAPGCIRIQKWNPATCPCEPISLDGS